jgi:hypothetical protein
MYKPYLEILKENVNNIKKLSEAPINTVTKVVGKEVNNISRMKKILADKLIKLWDEKIKVRNMEKIGKISKEKANILAKELTKKQEEYREFLSKLKKHV